MASDADGADVEPATAGPPAEGPVEVEYAALYRVVHAAVKDAILDAIGTVLLVGLATVLVLVGVQAVLASRGVPTTAAGLGIVVIGLSLAASTLDLIPSVSSRL